MNWGCPSPLTNSAMPSMATRTISFISSIWQRLCFGTTISRKPRSVSKGWCKSSRRPGSGVAARQSAGARNITPRRQTSCAGASQEIFEPTAFRQLKSLLKSNAHQ